MKKTLIVSLVLAACLFGTLFYLVLSKKTGDTQNLKIAYVRSQNLVYEYRGMEDAMSKFEKEKLNWQANIDTLKADYKKTLEDYQKNVINFSDEERVEIEKNLEHQYNNVFKYSESMSKSLEEREADILAGVLNQINSFSEEWAKENGYNLIFGTTTSGNILYADDAIDVTDELLKLLNTKYTGE